MFIVNLLEIAKTVQIFSTQPAIGGEKQFVGNELCWWVETRNDINKHGKQDLLRGAHSVK